MVVCENCRSKGFFLSEAVCSVCGKKGCSNYVNFLPKEYIEEMREKLQYAEYNDPSYRVKIKYFNLWTCSEQCFKTMQQNMLNIFSKKNEWLRSQHGTSNDQKSVMWKQLPVQT
jgi:hypothetical protein